jgi:hypothetical protein
MRTLLAAASRSTGNCRGSSIHEGSAFLRPPDNIGAKSGSHLRRKSIFELFLLVNGAENLLNFWFSKTGFESVFLSASQT